MKKFVLGFVSGAATYHFVFKELNDEEIKTELRNVIKKIDDALADTPTPTSDEPSEVYVHGTPPEQ